MTNTRPYLLPGVGGGGGAWCGDGGEDLTEESQGVLLILLNFSHFHEKEHFFFSTFLFEVTLM